MSLDLPKIEIDGVKAVWDEFHVINGAKGDPKAVVTFVVKDSEGKTVDVKRVDMEGEQFNRFFQNWEGPLAGRMVYGLLDPAVKPAELPQEIELEFAAKVKDQEPVSAEELEALLQTEPDKEIGIAKADGTSLTVKVSAALAALAAAGAGAYMYFFR